MTKQQDNVVRDLGQIGRYRVRVLALEGGKRVLDVREYVTNETFEGFTRRGVRLSLAEAGALAATLARVVTPRPLPAAPGC